MNISAWTRALVLSAVLALPGTALAQAPKAALFKANLTTPSAGTLASLTLTKPAKVFVKAKSGFLEFQLVLSGVESGGSPATLANNTLQVDLLIGGAFTTQNFNFDVIDGKISKSTKKFPVSNGSLPGGPSAGDPVEVAGARIRESGTGYIFGTVGVTLR